VDLLNNIEETGSINKAAKQMKMSYKKALDLIHTLNEQAARL
jgi:molybdate transport system regulatory protein